MTNIPEFIKPDRIQPDAFMLNINKYVIFFMRNDVSFRGHIKLECKIDDDRPVYGVELDDPVREGTNGTFNDISFFVCQPEHGVLLDKKIKYFELDESTGFVFNQDVKDIVQEKGKFDVNQSVLYKFKEDKKRAKIIRSGTIKGIFCYVVQMQDQNDSRPYIVVEGSLSELPQSEHYQYPRYQLTSGSNKGIQGNLNSCYLDTSVFSIFTFNAFLDNMLLDKCKDEDIEELRSIFRSEIVYPLRKNGFVSYGTISKFRDKLQSLSPSGKFVITERDPEEFLEQLFKLLTPNKYLLRTLPVNDMKNVQNCFLTQLFYEPSENKKIITVKDMLSLTFLEFNMLIHMPPKCMILQLPRDGRQLKKFERVSIPSQLDITPFILSTLKKCKDCSTKSLDVLFCSTCSLSRSKLTYYCREHKLNCTHPKTDMPATGNPFKHSVVLHLVSILCIEKTHYVSFVKTNDQLSKWIYFNSMETIENGIFTPCVRDTNLEQYFLKGSIGNGEYDRDVEKIEKFAFICIYKNPVMEFYNHDFNTIDG